MNQTKPMDTDPFPHALMAEKAVLSSMLQDASLYTRGRAEGIDDKAFHLPAHRTIFTEIATMPRNDNGEVDLITAIQHLSDKNILDRSGGMGGFLDIYNYSLTSGGWTSWVSTLREYKARRMALEAAENIGKAQDSAEAITHARDALNALTKAVSGKKRSSTAFDAANDFGHALKHAFDNGELPGKSTGIPELDTICGGMRPGELWVIAGKPSRGKSVLMLQMAAAYIERKNPIAVFSLEMMSHEVIGRFVSCMTRTDYTAITQPRTAVRHQLAAIQRGVKEIMEAPLWIDATGNQTIDTIAAEAERIRDENGGLDMIVVDYLQLIRGNRNSRESREEEVARISGALKQLAKHLQCTVVSASQLNEQNQTRESRAIEQDADALIFIADDGLMIGKLRNGQRNLVLPLKLNGLKQRFE